MRKIEPSQPVRRATPVDRARRIYQAFREFIHLEASGGIILVVAAVIALGWANSPWSQSYYDLWHLELSIGLGNWVFSHDLHWWINEALMVLFFLVVGLEIKREILVGELASIRQAALPIAAAAGGMIVPAVLYLTVNAGGAGMSGWGIPMATDIAFALGIMALVGSRVPISLKIFLTALAIVDDIGAVLVIALFYTSSVSWMYLAAAGGVLILLAALNIFGVRNIVVYSILGIVLWLMVLGSGLHATLAGILFAMTIPASRKINEADFLRRAQDHLQAFRHAVGTNQRLLSAQQQEALISLEGTVEDVEAPLQRMEHTLHPWVVFVIIPLFALANAGVTIGGNLSALLLDRVSLGIILGLVLGKQIGVTLASWIAVRFRFAQLPPGVSWKEIYAVGWLAGIGFTMSLFISELAFGGGEALEAAKVGILGASLITGVIGYLLLRLFVQRKSKGVQSSKSPL